MRYDEQVNMFGGFLAGILLAMEIERSAKDWIQRKAQAPRHPQDVMYDVSDRLLAQVFDRDTP